VGDLAMSGHVLLFPKFMLQPFAMRRLKAPNWVWSHGEEGLLADLEQAAWAVPLADEPASAYRGDDSATAWAEGYGGIGVGCNGGGARAGLVNRFQLKGIGPNPLVGRDQPYFHAYGGATLEECLLEALWSRVVAQVLPHGAVATYGVLTMGTQVRRKFPRTNHATHSARALAVREPTWRWGHAMRSTWFRPSTDTISFTWDVQRTRAAIQALANTAPTPLETLNDVKQWVQSALSRQAQQIAAARAKRLMHGSLTPSNLSWSGAWLDFAGGISTVSDYGRVILPRGAPDFLHEENVLLEALPDFCFHLHKYLPAARGLVDATAELQTHLRTGIRDLLGRRLLELSGWRLPDRLEPPDCALARQLVKHLGSGSQIPFTILQSDNDAPQVMPLRMTDIPLNALWIAVAIECADCGDAQRLASAILRDAVSPDRLSTAGTLHDGMRDFWRRRAKEANASQVQRAFFDALRWNLPCHALYRTQLYPELEAQVDNWGLAPSADAVTAWLESKIGSGNLHLGCTSLPIDWGAVAVSAAGAPSGVVAPFLLQRLRSLAAAQ